MARFPNCAKLRLVFSKLCQVSAWALPNCARSLPGLSLIVPELCLVLSELCQISAWSLPNCARSPPGLFRWAPRFRLGLLFVERVLLCFFRKPCQGCAKLRLIFSELSELCQISAWAFPKIVPDLSLVLSELCQISAWSLPTCARAPPGLFRRAPSFRLGLLFVERVLLCFSGNRAKDCFLFSCLVQVSQQGLQRGSTYECALPAPTTCASRRPTTSRHVMRDTALTLRLKLNGLRDTTLTLR